MASVLDVAAYILQQTGYVSTMKLQKLVYYSQAFHLVKTGFPLFSESIEAWANGPVAPALFNKHRGRYVIGPEDSPAIGNANKLYGDDRRCIDHVIRTLGDKTGSQLSSLTHAESPWVSARHGLPEGARSHNVISPESILAYYSSSSARSNPAFG